MKGSGYETSLTLLRDYSLFIAGGGGRRILRITWFLGKTFGNYPSLTEFN